VRKDGREGWGVKSQNEKQNEEQNSKTKNQSAPASFASHLPPNTKVEKTQKCKTKIENEKAIGSTYNTKLIKRSHLRTQTTFTQQQSFAGR
jgi:hypothetical protein